MSLFKEKDDYLTKAFQNQFNDSDSEKDEPTGTNLDESQECEREQSFKPEPKDENPSFKEEESFKYECIVLDCDGDDNNISSDQMIGQNCKRTAEDQVINISSDDEDVDIRSSTSNVLNSSFQHSSGVASQNTSQDLDDYNFNLKLTLAGSYKQFRTTHKTKLNETLKDLLKDLSSKGRSLIITLEERTISLEESPYSLRLKPGSILSAIEVIDSSISNPNEITVKLQDGNRKHTKEYKIIKSEPLLKLKQRYAKEFGINSIESIKFCFDGDIVDDESTSEELDIDDDCVIDVILF